MQTLPDLCNVPDFRLTWFCGIMIWQELASLVFLMGWLRTCDDSDHLAHFFYSIFHIAGITDELLQRAICNKTLKTF